MMICCVIVNVNLMVENIIFKSGIRNFVDMNVYSDKTHV